MAAKTNPFDEEFLKKLEYLYIISKKIVAGRQMAERKTRLVGSGIEFADHRAYARGDDFRGLDWKVFARTERLFMRLFEEEEDLYIYFLLDSSPSMLLGEPNKWAYAKKVAAALGYIGLSNLDRVSVIPFSGKLDGRLAPARGKSQIFKIFDFLHHLEAGENTSLEDAFSSFVAQNKRRGIAVVLSDFYDPSGFEEGLNKLRYFQFEPIVIQIFDERELNPKLSGELQLIDVETDELRELTLTPQLVREYRRAFQEFSDELEQFCTQKQMLYFRAPIQEEFDELVLRIFRAGGFLK